MYHHSPSNALSTPRRWCCATTILRDDRLLSPLFQRHSHFNTTRRRIRTFCSFASPFIQFLFTFNSFLLLVARIHICL
jgi:hypothetical protein